MYIGTWRAPWCALFVSWCARQQPVSSLNPADGRRSSVSGLAGAPGSVGDERGRSTAAARAVFLILYDSADSVDSGGGHIGFVVGNDTFQATIQTCERNTSDGVRAKSRELGRITGWGSVEPA